MFRTYMKCQKVAGLHRVVRLQRIYAAHELPELMKDENGNDVRCWIYSDKWDGETEVNVYGKKRIAKG